MTDRHTWGCHQLLLRPPCCCLLGSSPWTPPCSLFRTAVRSGPPRTARGSSCPTRGRPRPARQKVKHITLTWNVNKQTIRFYKSTLGFFSFFVSGLIFLIQYKEKSMKPLRIYPSGSADCLQRESQTHDCRHVLHKRHLRAEKSQTLNVTQTHRVKCFTTSNMFLKRLNSILFLKHF